MLERGMVSDKLRLATAIQKLAKHCQSSEELAEMLDKDFGVPVYQRRGKIAGVIFQNRKLRFASLGISKERMVELDRQQSFPNLKHRFD